MGHCYVHFAFLFTLSLWLFFAIIFNAIAVPDRVSSIIKLRSRYTNECSLLLTKIEAGVLFCSLLVAVTLYGLSRYLISTGAGFMNRRSSVKLTYRL